MKFIARSFLPAVLVFNVGYQKATLTTAFFTPLFPTVSNWQCGQSKRADVDDFAAPAAPAAQSVANRQDSVLLQPDQQPQGSYTSDVTSVSDDGMSEKSSPMTISGPPLDTKPDYDTMVGPLGPFMDQMFLVVFRQKLAEQVGFPDSNWPWNDYRGITELAARLNREQSRDRSEIQRRAQQTLRNLFPSWLPKWYAILFARPFPEFSARMNAWATSVAGTWLMGECIVNDIMVNDEKKRGQGLLVKRCRFLEESQCASVCVNSCKIPTQNFFWQDMGLPLTMEPNYETLECQFSFGKMPTPQTEWNAINTPCFAACPAGGSLRQYHDRFSILPNQKNSSSSLVASSSSSSSSSLCGLMEENPTVPST